MQHHRTVAGQRDSHASPASITHRDAQWNKQACNQQVVLSCQDRSDGAVVGGFQTPSTGSDVSSQADVPCRTVHSG